MGQPNHVTCGNLNCKSCYPKDDGIPRLHGWITPDYARQLIKKLAPFVIKNKNYLKDDMNTTLIMLPYPLSDKYLIAVDKESM